MTVKLIYYFLSISEITEDEAEDKLQDAIRERFSSFGDVISILHLTVVIPYLNIIRVLMRSLFYF